MALSQNLKIGYRGEQLAARKLLSDGFEIIDANFLTKAGETDIIALDKNKTLCFTEVKTRSAGAYFPPSEAVDYDKQLRLITNAKAFLKISDIKYNAIEFDIMEVVITDLNTAEFNLIRNAFGEDEAAYITAEIENRKNKSSKIKQIINYIKNRI